MSSDVRTLLVSSAIAGLMAGSLVACGSAEAPHETPAVETPAATTPAAATPAADPHAAATPAAADPAAQPAAATAHECAGKNSCKGQGGCSTGDGGCKGKNTCAGKGGCKAS